MLNASSQGISFVKNFIETLATTIYEPINIYQYEITILWQTSEPRHERFATEKNSHEILY